VLFIDARKLGRMISRVQAELDDAAIARIADTVAAWREIPPGPPLSKGGHEAGVVAGGASPFEKGGPRGIAYADIPGFCRSVKLAEIAQHGHVLTPGRYVGTEEVAEMAKLTEKLGEQMARGAELDELIRQKLGGLGYEF
jgi:type I restriction enzyme M protein